MIFIYLLIIVFLVAILVAGWYIYVKRWEMQPEEVPVKPTDLSTDGGQVIPPAPELMFDTPQNAWHAVRVLCDNAGLTYTQKNIICACIYQESRFNNKAVNINKNLKGVITSRDWGIVQVNDYFHCGPGKDFPSSEYVVANPQAAVEWMIKCYQEGLLKLWVSYSSGAYQQWLPSTSPMWQLA